MSRPASSETRARLFVASSTEGLELARALANSLRDIAEVTVWDEDVSRLGITFSEALGEILEKFDYAALILTPDDQRRRRGLDEMTPRDNVILELGLFLGRLPRDRVFAICPDDGSVVLPSDLKGVTVAQWDARRTDNNTIAAMRPAASAIRASLNTPANTLAQSAAIIVERRPSPQPDNQARLVEELVAAYGELTRVFLLPVGSTVFDVTLARSYMTQIKHLISRDTWFPGKPELFLLEARLELQESREMSVAAAPSAYRQSKLLWAQQSAEMAYRLCPTDDLARDLLLEIEHERAVLVGRDMSAAKRSNDR